ncbi:MAG: hypothetical protein J6581_02795 [Apibacter sp.]|nr:hypothetical protein [Apibacter sp.]
MTVKERLISYLKYEKISKSEFGRSIGVSSAYISSMRKSIQPDKIKSISLNYPNLNTEWLLTGEGEMLKEPESPKYREVKEVDPNYMDTIKQLNNILIYTKLNPRSFSKKIGLARPQAIYDIQGGKTKNFSQAMINKIISVFPEFNKSWLLTGEGEMLKEKTTTEENLKKENILGSFGFLEENVKLLKENNELLKQIVELTNRIRLLEDELRNSGKDQAIEEAI